MTAGEIVVEAEGLSIGYGSRAVVSDLDITLHAGEALALVGVNGSGKSTLLKTLAGLLAPVSGRVQVFGRDAGRSPHRLAYLGQFHPAAGLLPLQVRDVVTMARYRHRGLLGRMTRADHDAVTRSMERAGIAEHASAPLRSLSGGQQQRAYLAHALAREADLILLDEPTAGLDVAANEHYAELVREELARGAAVITATHDVRDAARCDQVILLAGRVVAAGPPTEVLSPERLLDAFGIALLAVPHEDHTDLVVPEHPHAHAHPHEPGERRRV
jgi:ABC-type Mn2+/Zn2+ transport system ATPase subunit